MAGSTGRSRQGNIQKRNSGRFLSDAGGKLSSLKQTDDSCLWVPAVSINGGLVFVNLATSQVLDLSGGNVNKGTVVGTYNANNTPAQAWRLIAVLLVENGYYILNHTSANKVLDISGGSLNSGAKVHLFASNGSNAQKWLVTNIGNSCISIKGAASKKCLDIPNGNAVHAASLQQYDDNGSAAQKWLVEIGDNGGIIIRSFKNGIVLGAISNDLKLVDMATHADDEGVFADQSWIFASTTYFEGPQARRDANARQNRVLYSCDHTPSPGSGLCAAWVANVFNNAGLGYDGKDARDFYWSYCHDSNRNDLKVGMIIAVPSHNKSYLGGIYGHICLYIGDGMVMDYIGNLRKTSLSHWLSYYGNVYTPKWGWYRNIALA